MRPRGRRARPARVPPRGATVARLGLRPRAVVAALFWLGGATLIALDDGEPGGARDGASAFLIFAALAPIAGVFAYAYRRHLIGATWTREMRNLMLASLALYLRHLVGARRARQCRAVERDADLPARARRLAGATLSRADAADLSAGALTRLPRPRLTPSWRGNVARVGVAPTAHATRDLLLARLKAAMIATMHLALEHLVAGAPGKRRRLRGRLTGAEKAQQGREAQGGSDHRQETQ